MSSKSGTAVANIKHPDNINVANCYAALLNNGYLAGGQTVILESVERYLIQRLCDLDTLNKSDCCIDYAPFTDNNKAGIPFLNRFFSWIRINLNFENPIAQFQLSEECFTHTKFSRTLFVYNSAADGDIAWHHIPEDSFTKAGRQMERLIQCSREQGINLIIMIATDKYDAYEPWISDEHQENPTLSRVPHNPQILDTRPILRQAIDAGVKDVYKINNTHWSVVGADLVGEAIYERMKQIQWLPQTSSR